MVPNGSNESNWRKYAKAAWGRLASFVPFMTLRLTKDRGHPQHNIVEKPGRADHNSAKTNGNNKSPPPTEGWHTEERTHRKRERGYWNWSLIFSAVAMGGAIAAAIFTGSSVRAGWKAVRLSQDAIVEENRAWVGTSSAAIISGIVEGKPIVGTISYRNFGKEPAVNVGEAINVTMVAAKAWNSIGKDSGIDREQQWITNCLRFSAPHNAFIVFPSESSISGDTLTWRVDDASQAIKFSNVISGDDILLIQMCMVYQTFGITKHTVSCFYYNARDFNAGTALNNLSICDLAYAD